MMKNRKGPYKSQAPKEKKIRRAPCSDPAKYFTQADLESISLTDANGTLTDYDRALAEQRVKNKARTHRRQVITEVRQQAVEVPGGAILIRPAFGRPPSFTLNVERSAVATVLNYDAA